MKPLVLGALAGAALGFVVAVSVASGLDNATIDGVRSGSGRSPAEIALSVLSTNPGGMAASLLPFALGGAAVFYVGAKVIR